jgi:hypothetical protein
MGYLTSKSWWEAAGTRAIKTMAQTFLSIAGVGAALDDVNWTMTASATVLAGVLSLATSLTGLPEVDQEGEEE